MSEHQQSANGDVIHPASVAVPGVESKAPSGLAASSPVVLMLMLAHLVLTAVNFPYYFELLRAGLVSMTTAVLTLLGWIFLYLGGVQNARKSRSSGTLWMIATVFLALAYPGLRMMYMPGGLVLFGCLLALAGWWSVRQAKKSA